MAFRINGRFKKISCEAMQENVENKLLNASAEIFSQIISFILIEQNIKQKSIVVVTKNGVIKKTSIEKHLISNASRIEGARCIDLDEGNKVVCCFIAEEADDIVVMTKSGKINRFNANEIRETKLNGYGVRGISLEYDDSGGEDEVIDAFCIPVSRPPSDNIICISEFGYAAVFEQRDLSTYERNYKGVIGQKLLSATGNTALCRLMSASSSIKIETNESRSINLPTESIKICRRPSKGTLIATLDKNEKIIRSINN